MPLRGRLHSCFNPNRVQSWSWRWLAEPRANQPALSLSQSRLSLEGVESPINPIGTKVPHMPRMSR